MEFTKKLKAIRLAESLSREEMSAIVGVPAKTIANAEQGVSEPKIGTITKITGHERFKKYTFWLMTGDSLPELGQVSPDLAIQERCGLVDYADAIGVEQGKRLRAIRIAEGLKLTELSTILNLDVGILSEFEKGSSGIFGEIVAKATNNVRFKKYTFWLMTGETLPESGQICPELPIQERCGLLPANAKSKLQ